MSEEESAKRRGKGEMKREKGQGSSAKSSEKVKGKKLRQGQV